MSTAKHKIEKGFNPVTELRSITSRLSAEQRKILYLLLWFTMTTLIGYLRGREYITLDMELTFKDWLQVALDGLTVGTPLYAASKVGVIPVDEGNR